MQERYIEEWKKPFLTTPSFDRCTSYAKLLQLKEVVPDLNQAGFLSEERVVSLASYTAGILLLYAFQRLDRDIIVALQQLADERQVVEQMRALFSGEKVNWIEGYESEERAVLHPALRDVFDVPVCPEQPVKEEVETELQKLREFDEVAKDYENLILIGIGGSELGPHALVEALEPYHLPGKRIFYVSNVDPDEITSVLRQVDLAKTLVAVISKSGTTIETATNEARIRHAFESSGISARNHFIAVTSPQTPMDDQTKYRSIFYLFDYVGGRYSSTSVVGGIPITFMAGVNGFFELLDGASEMDRSALRKDIRDNLPLLMALISVWNRNFLEIPTTAVIPYSKSLHRFPAHLQQCSMESNGKRVTRQGTFVEKSTGSIIWGEPGTNAQHSFFQLLHQGTDTIAVEFIGFKESQYGQDFVFQETDSQDKLLANMIAQAVALAQGRDSENPNKLFPGNRPSLILLGKKLDARTLGSLLALYEHKIAFEGFIWGINSFDQEGVQLGKHLATSMLKSIQARKDGKDDIAAPETGRRVLDLLDDLAAGRALLADTKHVSD